MNETHSFGYGQNGEAPPTPRIQFDFIWRNGTPTVIVDPPPPGWPASSMQTQALQYNDVGMAGGQPKDYSFAFSNSRFGPEFTQLELNAGG
jgi:hypothetical protein